jgi:hypothetical protein
MAQHHKVESDLTAEHLEQLKSYVREKNYTRTTDDCHTWTLGHGYTIGRTAVGNWLAKFRIEDSQRASGELARTLIDAAKQEGTVAISDAATLQLSQMVFTQLLQMQARGDVDTKELFGVSMALKNVIGAKKQVDELRGKFDEKAKALVAKRSITQDDIDEVRKAVFG